MQCRECGKPIEGHPDTCHPFLTFMFALALAGITCSFVFAILAAVI